MLFARSARSIAAACLALVVLLGTAPGPVAALEPPRPLPGYRPAFVTETDTRPWIDCMWASAAMLLDKWTNGDVRVSHGRLRNLSGDHGGGSSLAELQVAFRRLGFQVALTPGGGSRLTWGGLLARLRRGAGAVVLGDDSDLPRWYGRWDRAFWKKKGTDDNHAIYVERYQPSRGRVWVMDPLARGSWRGEWMSIGALRRFAWSSGGFVTAVASPTAKAAPFAKVKLGTAVMSVSGGAVAARWRVRAPKGWRFGGADTRVSFARAAAPLAAAATAAATAQRAGQDPAPRRPTARMEDRTLVASAAVPTTPGAWLARFTLSDRRFGRRVAASAPAAVFVPGARSADIHLRVRDTTPSAGDQVVISISVENTGALSWVDEAGPMPDGSDAQVLTTRATATWVAVGAGTAQAAAGAGPDDAAPAPVLLDRLPLVAGRTGLLRATLVVPREPGRWALVIDLEDNVNGSFAALGSAPGVLLFEVAAAREAERVR